jgi:hypothetical protein
MYQVTEVTNMVTHLDAKLQQRTTLDLLLLYDVLFPRLRVVLDLGALPNDRLCLVI